MKGSRCHPRAIALLVLVIAITSCAIGQSNTWTLKAHMLVHRNVLSAASGQDGRIYAIGGQQNNAETIGSAEAYDPSTDTWSFVAPLPKSRCSSAAVTGPDGRIYVIGGVSVINGVQDPSTNFSVVAYDTATDTWTAVAGLPQGMPSPSAALGNDGRIYAIQGYDGVTNAFAYGYDIASNTWTPITTVPNARFLSPAVTAGPDGLIYVLGGISLPGIAIKKTAVTFDAHADVWQDAPDMTSSHFGGTAATGGDQRVYAIGGITSLGDPPSKKVEAFDPVMGSWSSVPDMHVGRQGMASATGLDGKVYVLGGEDFSGAFDSVDCFQPSRLRSHGEDFSIVEGSEFSGEVATFSDLNLAHTAIDFTASIDWGDGTAPTTASVVAGGSPGHFEVDATHAYSQFGSYVTTITVSDGDGDTASAKGKATVLNALVHSTPHNFTAYANVQFTGVVGTVIDDNPLAKLSDFFNLGLSWGDGSPFDTLTIATNGAGGFNLIGSHKYLIPGTYTAHVEVFETGEFIAFDVIATVTPAPPAVTGHDFSGIEGNKYIGQVAHFTDADPTLVAGNFTATVNWGDGGSSTGSVVPDGVGGFNVNGNHTYADEGDYTVHVTVTVTGGPSGSGDSEATIADAPLTASGFNLTCKGTNFSDTIAAFTDGNPLAVASEFSAAIFWGDGKSSTGTVIKAGSGFKVTGKHSYLKKGKYTVTITIRDGGGSTASATTHINAGPVK